MNKIGIVKGDYEITSMNGIFDQKRLFSATCRVCGNVRIMQYAEFARFRNLHNVKNCKKTYMNNEIGKIYGDFIITSWNNDWTYNVECRKCGKEKILKRNDLNNLKRVNHIHCIDIENDNTPEWKKFHSIWVSMRNRTSNKNNKHYDSYGGRGISSEDYLYFIDFKRDLYSDFLASVKKFGLKEVSIDRIDNDKSYTKENIRFTDKRTQARNTRRIKDIIGVSPCGAKHEFRIMKDFASEHGLSSSCISMCVRGKSLHHKGWRFSYK